MSPIVLDINVDEGKNNVRVLSVKEYTSILGLNSSVCCPMNLRSWTLLTVICSDTHFLYLTLMQTLLFSREAGRTPEGECLTAFPTFNFFFSFPESC